MRLISTHAQTDSFDSMRSRRDNLGGRNRYFKFGNYIQEHVLTAFYCRSIYCCTCRVQITVSISALIISKDIYSVVVKDSTSGTASSTNWTRQLTLPLQPIGSMNMNWTTDLDPGRIHLQRVGSFHLIEITGNYSVKISQPTVNIQFANSNSFRIASGKSSCLNDPSDFATQQIQVLNP